MQIGGWWTEERLELRGWFQRNAPALGDLYEIALALLFENRLPGRVYFVGHAVREIRNRLPDVICGERVGGYLDYKGRIDAIAGMWRDAGFGKGPFEDRSRAIEVPLRTEIRIPRNLYLELDGLIGEHEDARTRPEEVAKRLFEACGHENRSFQDELRPTLEQWLDVTDWFMRNTHVDRRTKTEISFDEVRRKFELFELTLGALVGRFFSTVEGLDEILEETNS